jgi:hypothetical protein
MLRPPFYGGISKGDKEKTASDSQRRFAMKCSA